MSDFDIKVETCGNELDRMEMMEIENDGGKCNGPNGNGKVL